MNLLSYVSLATGLISFTISIYSFNDARRTRRHVEKHLRKNETYSETILAHVERDVL